MQVSVVTPPASIVSLAEAKRHLRVDHDDEDAYITDLVEVATSWLDGPAGWLGRSLGVQTLEAVVPAADWRSRRPLPCPPLVSVLTETLSGDGRSMTVRYRAGYDFAGEGDARKSTVPAPIRHAILLMVGHLYANRDAVTSTAAKPEQLPLGVDALLSPYRMWSV